MTAKDLKKIDMLTVIFQVNRALMKLGNKNYKSKDYQKCILDMFKETDKLKKKYTPTFLKKKNT